jgi:hypothetical protein
MTVKMIAAFVLTFVGLNVALSSCNNVKDANEDNFKQAINKVIAEVKVGCVSVLRSRETFPVKIPKGSLSQVEALNSLVKVGLLSSKEVTIQGLPRAMAAGIEYSVTPEGKKVYTSNANHNAAFAPGFCIGDAEVAKILNFTQPQSQPDSSTTSRVRFTYRFKNLAKWFEDPEVQASLNSQSKWGQYVNGGRGLDQILATKDNPPEEEINLFLTNNGWVDSL